MKIEKEQIIKVIDFWQKAAKKDYLREREILEEINFKSKEIIDLVGPRRSGKSSILKLIIKRLNLSNDFLYINFEDPFFIENNNPAIIEELILIFKEYFNPRLSHIFFDEMQEIKQWEKALRKLRDGGDYKIFITGSSSKLLSGEIATLITGRHLSYKIFPLSFREFLLFKDIRIEGGRDIIVKEKALNKKFDEYLKMGGFPEIVLENNIELLKNYFFDILQKDIMARHEIRDKSILEKMAVYLLSNAAKTVSLESIKKTYGISFASASVYLEYLKEAMLIFDLPQFSYSLKKQAKTLKKIYAVDTGLANNVSFRFSEDRGRILENAIFLELKIKERWNELYYYKTKNNLEVDFLVKEKSKPKQLIQAAWTLADKKTKEREIKSLLAAMDELKLKEGLILTRDEEAEIKTKNKIIVVKPVWKWILEN
ncbi:ATP-binding protein [Candidatus Falkowbacteria bacterium]|nr:ATP-binding protein [Candidatus Falkowbacteria bacterium]